MTDDWTIEEMKGWSYAEAGEPVSDEEFFAVQAELGLCGREVREHGPRAHCGREAGHEGRCG